MRPFETGALAMLAMLLTLGVASAQVGPAAPGVSVTERIRVSHIRASQVVAALRADPAQASGQAQTASSALPRGIDTIGADDREQVLVVRGSVRAIAELKRIVPLLDVAPTQIQLNMRVLRSERQRGTRRLAVRVIAAPVIKTTNNSVATMNLAGGEVGTEIQVQPRLNGDGTFSVQASFTVTLAGRAGDGAPGPVARSVSGMCRVPARRRSVVLCILEGAASGARAGRSALPSPVEQPGFYLELAPAVAR